MSDISLSKAVRTNLLSLQNTAEMMAKTQERLATGNKVNSALDNPTNFFTASSLNSRAGDLNSLMDSMSNGIKTLEAADNGLTSITKTLESMQSTLRQARQDKSFLTDTYEVKTDSTLKVSGGRFGEEREIRLQEPSGGTQATLTGALPYAAPTASGEEGLGARTLIAYDSSFGDGDKLRIDGTEISLTAGAYTDATDLAARIGAAMTVAGVTGYTTGVSAGGQVYIEQADKTLPSPEIEFVTGINAATYGETTFVYSAANIGTITVGGQNIPNGGGTFEEFVASLKSKGEAGGYEVKEDPASKRITLVSTTPAGAAPTITGLRENADATGSSRSFAVNLANVNGTSVFGSAAFGAAPASLGAMITTLNGDAGFNTNYVATQDGGNLVITSKTLGAASPVPAETVDGGAGLTAVANSAASGANAITDGIAVTRIAGTTGTFLTEVEAASHKITLTHGTKTAEINIVGRDSSLFATTNQTKLINDQLKAAGINDVEASFDADDKLIFTSTTAEAKTLAVSGESSGLFGTETVSTGSPAVSAYKSSNAVDQFVEEINRNAETAGFIRASNDNGKLRIENLSTQQLDVSFDKDGDGVGAATTHKIGGNTVRASLADEYNDLKNQLDRLADDASFNGINLLRGDNLRITFNESGNSFIDIQTPGADGINAGTLKLDQIAAIDLDQDMDIDGLLASVKQSLNQVRTQSSQFGSNLSIVQNRQDFTKQMINTLETGAANLTLADMNEEAANLLALQTRQSLSSSSLSLASQADQSVLQLLQ